VSISARQHEILVKTLELYIQTGSPVGSKALSDVVDVSSSTIRSELSALESQGLLTHPHTSAGRVPTDAGYRYYVDALMTGEWKGEDKPPFQEPCFEAPDGYGNLDELLQGVSEGMSEVTSLLAVVAGPSALGDPVARVSHLQLSGGTYLLVVSTESGLSSSTTITLPFHVDNEELREILGSLNAFLGDRPAMTQVAAARRVLDGYNPLAVAAVLEAVEVLSQATERGLFIRGASALLARLDGLDPKSLSAVVEIFERRRWLLKLVGDALKRSVSNSSRVVVSIGAESGFYGLSGTSLVAAAYGRHERPCGVVSLIGPKRMEYNAAISTVRSAAETLTYCLDSGF
jgi:heat-inducible transcriptional repressor